MADDPTRRGAPGPVAAALPEEPAPDHRSIGEAAREFVRELGLPRLLIALFVVLLFGVGFATHMDLGTLMTDSLLRIARNGILVLALLPAVQGGLGLNFGLPLGILCGLLSCVITLNAGMTGWPALGVTSVLAALIATPAGIAYGWLLNRTRGQEMMVGTYLGFAVVSGMSIFWATAPFHNPQLVWAIGGRGLRTTLTLTGFYDGLLDKLWALELGPRGLLWAGSYPPEAVWLTIPTGTLLVFAGLCALVALFFRTRAGLTISAARSNPRFARAAGISDEVTRVQAATLSTVLAAVGIVVFCQSYGFVQLYTAPLLMAFPTVACLLIGGASVSRATLTHVLVGTFLFQSILTVALPVTSQVVHGDISETARLIIQNGMILYALTRKGTT